MKKLLLMILLLMVVVTGCNKPILEKNNEKTEENIPEESISEEVDEEELDLDIAIGKEAPNFTLKNLKDEEVSLSDYRGKIVLINFWSTGCTWCQKEMPDLEKLDKENDDLVVLAVDVMEKKETVENYIEKGNYEFEVLLDEDGEIAMTYLISGFPTSYFVDKEGILLGGVPGYMTHEQMESILNNIREEE